MDIHALDGIMGLAMKMEMDTTNQTEDFSDVMMVNPFEKAESIVQVEGRINTYDILDYVYPEALLEDLLELTAKGENI